VDADGVHVNVGAKLESEMIEDAGRIARDCHQNGVPLLAMMYPRGPDVDDPHAVENLEHVARLGAELGADLVKCPYTGDKDTFQRVVDGCPAPIVISGGPKTDDRREFYQMIEGAVDAGASGVSIGRNVFQADDPTLTTRAINRIVCQGDTADEVLATGKTAELAP